MTIPPDNLSLLLLSFMLERTDFYKFPLTSTHTIDTQNNFISSLTILDIVFHYIHLQHLQDPLLFSPCPTLCPLEKNLSYSIYAVYIVLDMEAFL